MRAAAARVKAEQEKKRHEEEREKKRLKIAAEAAEAERLARICEQEREKQFCPEKHEEAAKAARLKHKQLEEALHTRREEEENLARELEEMKEENKAHKHAKEQSAVTTVTPMPSLPSSPSGGSTITMPPAPPVVPMNVDPPEAQPTEVEKDHADARSAQVALGNMFPTSTSVDQSHEGSHSSYPDPGLSSDNKDVDSQAEDKLLESNEGDGDVVMEDGDIPAEDVIMSALSEMD